MSLNGLRFGAIGLTVALAATGCGRDKSSDGESGTDATGFITSTEDCQGYQPTQGINGDTIKIGTIRPESGPYALFGTVTEGLKAFVDATNTAGGIKAGDGKTYKLELVKADDAYDPAKTPTAVAKLVDQEKVFALVGEIGTAPALAIRDELNQRCIPNLALGSGSTKWGEVAAYPWYMGGLSSYATEIHNIVEFLKKENASAKISLLYQNDDFGKAYQDTLKREIAGTQMSVVAEASYEVTQPSVQSQVAQLAGSNADVLIIGITGAQCPAALKFRPETWKPMTFVSLTCSGNTSLAVAGDAAEGVYASNFQFDPANPEDMKNPRVKDFHDRALAAGLDEGAINGGIAAVGWGFGVVFAEILKNAKEVTRLGVMNSAHSLDVENVGITRDGVKLVTKGKDDPWLFEQLRVVRRENSKWVEVAPMNDYNGQSNKYAGM